MKKLFFSMVLFGSLSTSFQTQASPMCLMPEPILCAATVLGSIILASENSGSNFRTLNSSSKESKIRQIVQDTTRDNLDLRIIRYAKNSNGFPGIISRYESNKIEGNLSLESLYSFNPKIFKDLDLLASIIAENLDQGSEDLFGKKQTEDQSINWARYADISKEAMILYHDLFALD